MAAVAPQPSAQDVIAAQMRYGPNAGLALQRSQYLADALSRLQQQGAQDIRTPTSLAANLLADGITQWAKNKADREAMTAYGVDQKNRTDKAFAGTPGDPSYQPPQAPAPQPADPSPQAIAPVASLAPAAQPATPAKPDPLLVKMMLTEAGGEGDNGMSAVGHVAMNRLAKGYGGATSLADVLTAPHQFAVDSKNSSIPATDPRYQHAEALAAALGGQPDPTGGATQFLNPELTQKLYGHVPSWADGSGQRIGHHVFYGGAPNAVAQNPPPGPTAGTPPQPIQITNAAGPAQAPTAGPPQPYQVASNGPTPPPPSQPSPPAQAQGGAGMAPAPAGPLPGGGAGAGPPQTYVSPQEWQYARKLADDPQTRDQGLALAEQLRIRSLTPPDASKPYWGADGRAHFAPGTEFTDQASPSPNQIVQRGPDNQIHVTANPAYGSVPAGAAMNGSGAINQLQVAEKPRFRIPGSPGVYTLDEKGNPQKVADDNYTVKDVGSTMQELTASPQYDKAVKLTEMYRGATQAAQRPGGISDAELKDNAAQIFSGGVARQFNSKMIDEGQGPWLRLTQIIPELRSGQKISPQGRQAILQAMHDYVTESQGAFGSLAQSKSAFAAQNGVDLSPFIKPLMRDLPAVPDLSKIPTGIDGYPAGPQNPPSAIAPPGTSGIGGLAPGGGPAPVHVRTPEEASRLPHGTPIVLPDGRLGRVP